MKPPKELNLAQPKSLKVAVQTMQDAEDHYYDVVDRIDRYRARVDQLKVNQQQLHEAGVAKTAEGLLDNADDARRHDEKLVFIEKELSRYEQSLEQLEPGLRNAAAEAMHQSKRDARREWEECWQAIQQAATDHIVETVGVYLVEAAGAHWSSASGRVEDWLLDVLRPRIESLVEGKQDFTYPVKKTPPMTPRQESSEAASVAATQKMEAELEVGNKRRQELWEVNHERGKKGLGPIGVELRKQTLGW